MTSSQPEKLSLDSLDIAGDNRAKLKVLFPSVFAETRNDDGELVESIDFEKLKAELGSFSDVFENRRDRYGMDWPGKKDCIKLVQQPATGTLKPCREESVNFDDTENLFIEGDNLEVLKLLQKSYYGKVKMIYIDPPYNTGKEFIYPDHYSETLETYLSYAGLVDDEGKKFSTNTPNEGRFHTKWLNMMYPRLYLARNLLKEDGVIFISIDDNEVVNLRSLCNEIFGEENFIASLVWEKTRKNDAKFFSVGHEYMLCFARNLSHLKEVKTIWREAKPGAAEIYEQYLDLKKKYKNDLKSIEEELKKWYKTLPTKHPSKKLSRYKQIDEYGPWRDRDISWPGGGGPKYDVIHPITRKACKVPDDGWRFSTPESMQKQIDKGLVFFRDDHTKPPMRKAHLMPAPGETDVEDIDNDSEEVEVGLQVMPTVIYKQSQVAIKFLRKLMGGKLFDNPKDHEVLMRMIRYIAETDDIIVDFFSGSCATAQAVLETNKEDGKKLKFIMVQLPEPCDEKSEAYKAGYKTIADIGKARISRVIQRSEQEQEEKRQESMELLPGMVDPLISLDLGFKTLKLDNSNFKPWNGSTTAEADLAEQLELHIDHINPTATQEDLLYELLLKSGFMPTEKIEKRQLADKTVYAISDGALLICLENEVTKDLIDAIVTAEPQQFLCLDKAFNGNDQLKANAVQTFNALNQNRDREMSIIFKTI